MDKDFNAKHYLTGQALLAIETAALLI